MGGGWVSPLLEQQLLASHKLVTHVVGASGTFGWDSVKLWCQLSLVSGFMASSGEAGIKYSAVHNLLEP